MLTELLAQFNVADKSGQNRLVYNAAWQANQQRLIQLGQEFGAKVTVDDYGSVYLDFPGSQPGLAVATGSHMDTVQHGGQYDGLYGVLGGLCAIEQLRQTYDRPRKTLRLIAFSEEEGSRFPAAFTGSKFYLGQPQTQPLLDDAGISFETARQQAVTPLQALPQVHTKRPALPATFTELHIEQGPRLKLAHKAIGLVTGIVAQRRYVVTVHGQANHAGTTPMIHRQDAVQRASALMTHLYDVAQQGSASLTFTIGAITVHPNVDNVIAGECRFTVDCRDETDAKLTQFTQQLDACVAADPQVTLTPTLTVSATRLSHALLRQNELLAQELGLPYEQLFSGAGHDSQIMYTAVPTTMLFVPSDNGVSHCPEEHTSAADLAKGVALLAASLYQQAY
ncbi:M20 family metallo-hydrolase [Loigolactobacillus bifermentans]|uniref:N-carbamoyl-l-amino-acid hydrolase n=1 Tax=Loigolactobacillus bifermentans DSM 20003 TaxID=1423726 RepID=A0A0R1H4E9_9LACO|nr:M20 family metallo-hydrolase [Loigolactobacillus bifermentans]KRK39443.1 n-carbamoyl-l-amino-acid hydrolase [Loigolactobacillus bifermentans DSM 20003]QGG61209.1 hydantoinase/carbamoylase family amidase [Loigolactobacillus bifermentans]